MKKILFPVPIVIDNELFMLTEQLSRHIVDTKLSFIVPYPNPQTNIANHGYSEYSQRQQNIQQQPNQVL